MYKITITNEDDVLVRRDVMSKLSDTGNERDGGPIYGYIPQEVTEHVSVELYSQQVEDMDIQAVIAAVNNMDVREHIEMLTPKEFMRATEVDKIDEAE